MPADVPVLIVGLLLFLVFLAGIFVTHLLVRSVSTPMEFHELKLRLRKRLPITSRVFGF
jgi:hypothetical protein